MTDWWVISNDEKKNKCVLLAQFRSRIIIPAHKGLKRSAEFREHSPMYVCTCSTKTKTKATERVLGKCHSTIFFIFSLGAYNFIDKDVSCECNCEYVGESSYPLQVPDDIHSQWKICKNLMPFQIGCISKGKCNVLLMRDNSYCLVVARGTGQWTNHIYSIQLLSLSEHSRKNIYELL